MCQDQAFSLPDTFFSCKTRRGDFAYVLNSQEKLDNTADYNAGLVKRATFTNDEAEAVLVGVPLCDVFNIDKLLLDGLEIRVDLNSDAFVLMGSETTLQAPFAHAQCV